MKKALFLLLSIATVSLAAPNPPTAQDPLIAITPATRSMAQTGGTAAINTSGSGTWRASVSDNWILLTGASGAAGYPVGYTVSANNGVETRIGYVYVSGYVHAITQAGLGATLESYSAEFERAGGSGSVQVNAPSGKTWHAASNVDWITVSTASGTGTGNCSFTVAAFNEVATRSGTLTIADNTFTVHQTGRRMQLKTSSATTDYFADTIKIRVNALADTEWVVSVNRDWLTVTDAGNGHGGDEVRVSVAENQSYNERSGTVTIGTETFSVRQLGRTALVFKINPTEVASFGVDGASGERIAVTATPDLGWTAQSSADWIELYSGYASGSGNGSVVYKVKPNPTLQPRSGAITVTAADGAVAAKRLDVAQEAAVASLTVGEYEFEAGGGSLTVGVSTGSIVGWNVIENLDWLSASVASMTGPGNVTLTAAANTSVQPRSGTIRIADHEFRVRQKGRGVSISYDETKVFDTDGKTTGDSTENVISVTADADVEWTAVASDPTWIVIYEGASGRGNGTVKFIVAPYVGSGELRTGMITIGDRIAYVTQRPYDLSIEPNGTWVDGNAGAGEIQVALDIDGVWNAIATEPWVTMVSGYSSGTGSGKVMFQYTDNNTGRERTGKIVIAGEIYTLTQAARQNFAVSATVEGHGGHVAGAGTYNLSTEISLEAVPESGYAFDHWILPGGGTSTENPVSVTVTAAQSYGAVFAPLTPQLSVASASRKGVTPEWTNLAWATEWRVWRGTSSDRGRATKIATLANDGTCTHLDASGTENQSYWYWIEAVGVEDDVWSNAVQGKREKKTFAISYTNLRGSTHSNPATYREGTAQTFSAPSGRVGFTFAGWTPSGITADTSGDVVVRANWIQNEYVVRFDLNGADGAMADERFTYGLWKFLAPTNFSRSGCTFIGWAESATATAPMYADAESVKNLSSSHNAVITLYAVWDGAIPCIFPDLGMSASATQIASILNRCVDGARLAANITNAGEYNAFRAWANSVRIDGGALAGEEGVMNSPHTWLSFALGQEALLAAEPGQGDLFIIELQPVDGGASTFDLTFGLKNVFVGPDATSANLAKVFSIEGTESLAEPFSEVPVLVETLAPENGDVLGVVRPKTDADSFFFRVITRPLPSALYEISFNSAGGSAVVSITLPYGASVTPPADPTRAGYVFSGWDDAVPATMPANDTTLTAQWTPISYVVKFNANGGSGTMANESFTYGTAKALTANAFTRTGYTFAGWAKSAGGAKAYNDQQSVSNLTTTNGGTVNLYAKWTANTYSVKFNKNATDATGTMANESFAYGTSKALTANAFTREGYSFAGWATSASGAKVYDDAQSVSNLASTNGATVNLYAIWTANTYAVKFNSNGGNGTMANEAFTYGTAKGLTANAFTREGYTFAGWATSASGAKVYDDEQRVLNLATTDGATVNLYAVWAEDNPETPSASNGLAVRYYDVSSSGFSTWTQSEAAMTNYFAALTPTIVTNTADWGESLQSGFQEDSVASYFRNYPDLWLDMVSTNRYHGKYADKSQDHFAMLFEGELDVAQAGSYSFATSCDDAIVLYIDGVRVCSLSVNWNSQPSTTGTISLTLGKHRIAIGTYEGGGSAGMFVEWKRPGDTQWSPLPQSVLSHGDSTDTDAIDADWFVDAENGSDANAGTSWSAPFATIQAAIDVAGTGETILVADGVYAPISASGKKICIRSVNGASSSIIDASGYSTCAADLGNNTTNAVLQGFTLRNGHGGVSGGIVRQCIITGSQGASGVDHAVAENCLIYGNNAINGGGVIGSLVRNCTIVGNNASSNGGGSYCCALYNCILYGNTRKGSPSSDSATLYNGNWSEGGILENLGHVTESTVTTDPGFVDAANGDYRLSASSPCIDAGNNVHAPAGTDLAGNPRIVGSTVDIGCYEFAQ